MDSSTAPLNQDYYDWLEENDENEDEPIRLKKSSARRAEIQWKLWKRFCIFRAKHHLSDEAVLLSLDTATIQRIKTYMHWYLDTHDTVRDLDSFYTVMRVWRMMYALRTAHRISRETAALMKQDSEANLRAEKTEEGWIISDTKGLDEKKLNQSTQQLTKNAGFKQRVTFYLFRRGAATAINKIATSAERNHAIGYKRSELFYNHYIRAVVGVDTQLAFLGTLLRELLVRLAGYISLTRDPRAIAAFCAENDKDVKNDEIVTSLNEKLKSLRFDIISSYSQIKKAHGTLISKHYRNVQEKLKLRRKWVRKEHERQFLSSYFVNAGNREIDRQRRGDAPIESPSPPTFLILERTELARLLCCNDNVDDMDEKILTDHRRLALKNMISLSSLRSPPVLRTLPQGKRKKGNSVEETTD
ncbi:MAG: hypothetical protein Q9159_001988 [Coniocarpon cinnabarinum]